MSGCFVEERIEQVAEVFLSIRHQSDKLLRMPAVQITDEDDEDETVS